MDNGTTTTTRTKNYGTRLTDEDRALREMQYDKTMNDIRNGMGIIKAQKKNGINTFTFYTLADMKGDREELRKYVRQDVKPYGKRRKKARKFYGNRYTGPVNTSTAMQKIKDNIARLQSELAVEYTKLGMLTANGKVNT